MSSPTLLSTIEYSKRFNFNRRVGIGNSLEPAITSANTVMQTLLGPPFAWRWNRVTTGFITTAGQQDYTLFNWAANTAVSLTWVTVDPNGNCQSVTTAGTTGGSAPSWNNTKGGTTTDNSAVWTNLGPIGTSVSQTYTFGWIETVAYQDVNVNPPKWNEIESKICLSLDSSETQPRYISAQGDDGSGNITFRLMPVPDAAYPVAITLQEKAPVFTSLNQTWAPVPNEYIHIPSWGFLSLFFLFSDDPRFGLANQKFVTSLLSANEGLDETQRNAFLQNWQFITGQPVSNMNRMTQGTQARGV